MDHFQIRVFGGGIAEVFSKGPTVTNQDNRYRANVVTSMGKIVHKG